MSAITHIFFGLRHVLLDPARWQPCYTEHIGRIMAARCGATPDQWSAAYCAVLADWDSYYADLDLAGERGSADLWEGMFRTTRALFRLVGVPEPDTPTLTQLARDLPALATEPCAALYPDVRPAVTALVEMGCTLGVAATTISGQSHAALLGGGLSDQFTGTIIGPDVIEHFPPDRTFFERAAHRADVDPSRCLVVTSDRAAFSGAGDAGMHTVLLDRSGIRADARVIHDLTALPPNLRRITQQP